MYTYQLIYWPLYLTKLTGSCISSESRSHLLPFCRSLMSLCTIVYFSLCCKLIKLKVEMSWVLLNATSVYTLILPKSVANEMRKHSFSGCRSWNNISGSLIPSTKWTGSTTFSPMVAFKITTKAGRKKHCAQPWIKKGERWVADPNRTHQIRLLL